MFKKNINLFNYLIAICLPFLTLFSPDWLRINGISPCWTVIWLLPFSIVNGPLRASIASILIGLLMDSFTIGDVSYMPSLFVLSLIWGRYGRRNKNIDIFLNLGLMAILGTAFVGFSIWLQKIFMYGVLRNNWFHAWALHAMISQVIITGLVAPLISSWLLLTYKKN